MNKAVFLCLAALALACLHAGAEPPKLDALFPAGGQAGSSFSVVVSGKVDEKAWLICSTPGVQWMATGKKGEFQARISPSTPHGLHLVHAVNAEGISLPRWFSVGGLVELGEVEPNNEVAAPMKLEKLPVCVNGRLDPAGDVDGYSVRLKAGQELAGLVEAYSLGSPVDVMLHVLDEAGSRLLTASDGRNLDPEFFFKAEKEGDYTVQLTGFVHPPQANVSFTGGSTVVYRLHLSTGPVVRYIHPAVVAVNGKTTVALHGVGPDSKKSSHSLEAPRGALPGGVVQVSVPGAILPLQVLVSGAAAQPEKEPNQERNEATPVKVGVMSGQISGTADTDRFSIEMKKGDKLEARVWARRLGLPLDAMLIIEDPTGKVLSTVYDVGEEADPTAAWTAAVDGAHQVLVRDQFSLGEPGGFYVLEIGPAWPSFTATLSDGKALTLAPGKSVSFKASVKLLNGFKEPLTARLSGLPPGVHAPEVAVPEKGGEIELKLHAAANAIAAGGFIRVEIWTQGETAQAIPAAASLRGENKRGTSLLDDAEAIWLQVKD